MTTTAAFEAAGALGGDIAAVTDRLRRSVVIVRSGAGAGAGTAWRAGGRVVTNHHVVRGDSAGVEAWDGAAHDARVVARDTERDLALLEVRGLTLDPVAWRDPASLRAGELVVAVGNPWGRMGDAAVGVVLAAPGATTRGALQRGIYADVRLAPGNSGGPLADARGRVVGINSMVAGGLGVAIPADVVDAFVDGGAAERGVLGIVGLAVPLPGAHVDGEAGLLLTEVRAGSAAEGAGLIPGDIVLAVGGARGDIEALASRLRALVAGRPVHVELLRGGEPRTIEVRAAAA